MMVLFELHGLIAKITRPWARRQIRRIALRHKVHDIRLDYGIKSISLIGLYRDLPFKSIKAIDVIFSDSVTVNACELSLSGVNVPI
jgi:hypothetical protein